MSYQFPKIPNIKFVVTRPNPKSFIYDREEFESCSDLEEWAIDECDEEIFDAYKNADPDDRRGCDGMKEWVHLTMGLSELTELIEFKGWKVERVAE